jgi:hypothetical protein
VVVGLIDLEALEHLVLAAQVVVVLAAKTEQMP